MPIATVTFVDRDRQWFKSRQGLTESETERRISFCNYTIQSAEPLIVPDASVDARFCDSPLVLGFPLQGWLADADAQLYRAKRSGRNCCCMAEPAA